jgi:type I restriction enzyme, S subunit
MKDNWAYLCLGAISEHISDGSHNPPSGVEYSDYPMLSSKNIGFDYYDYDEPRYLSKEQFDTEDKRTNISDGDVLLTIVGTIGRTCCITAPFKRFTLQRSVAVIKPKKNLVLSRYLMHCLAAKNNVLEKEAKGVAQKGIYLKQLSKIIIPIPPKDEQERIVAELDLLTDIIGKQKAQLKELDTLASSIFYDVFGNPDTNEKGWGKKLLGDICAKKKDIQRAAKIYNKNDNILYIDISSIDNIHNVMTSPTPYTFGEAPSRAQQVVIKNDVLISLVRPNLKNVAIVSMNEDNLVASSGFCVLRAKKGLTAEFLFFVVKMDSFTDYLMQRVSGANYPAVREEDIKGYSSIVPPLSLQQSFAEKIEAIERQKANINASIAETQKLFDYTMDKYFG